MVKLPNLTELTKKMNLQGVLDNVKSAIGSVSNPQKSPTSDELSGKFNEILSLTSSLADMHAQQADAIANLKTKISELDKDIQNMKALAASMAASEQQKEAASVQTTVKTEETVVTPTVKKQKTTKTVETKDTDHP